MEQHGCILCTDGEGGKDYTCAFHGVEWFCGIEWEQNIKECETITKFKNTYKNLIFHRYRTNEQEYNSNSY